MTATERLDQIEARTNAATEGPWVVDEVHPFEGDPFWTVESTTDIGALSEVECVYIGDAKFIAAARSDVPALVSALRAVLDVARDMEDEAEASGHEPTGFYARLLTNKINTMLGGEL